MCCKQPRRDRWTIISFFCAYRVWDLNSSSHPIIWDLSDSSMNSVLSWIIFFLLWYVWHFSARFILFSINSLAFTSEITSFICQLTWLNNIGVSHLFLRLLIIKRRSEINIDISVNNANCVILILWIYLQNIDLKFIIKSWYRNRISFVQTCKISKLILQNCFWVVQVNKFCFMWA